MADGELLEQLPTKADLSGVNIPILVGHNRSEGNLVARFDKRIQNPAAYMRQMLGRVEEAEQTRILAGYKGLAPKKAFGALLTDMIYTLPLLRFADRYSTHAPVYVYRMDYYPPLLGLMGLNACHVVEVPLLFGTLSMLGKNLYAGDSRRARAVGQRLRRYWAAFAHTGRPEPEGLPCWPAYEPSSRTVFRFAPIDRILADPEAQKRVLYEYAPDLLA